MSMSQRLVRLLWPLSLLPVVGCSVSKPPSFVSLQPPVLTCESDPDIPMTDDPAAFADYTVRVWAAGQDCRDAVDAYRRWADHLPK